MAVEKFIPQKKVKVENYFLAGGRLARAKRIDLAIKACVKLGLPLKVFGRPFGDYGEELKKMAQGGKVEFLGEVNDAQLVSLYQRCRAFIFPAQEEDFGIVPVEAMRRSAGDCFGLRWGWKQLFPVNRRIFENPPSLPLLVFCKFQ